MLPQEVKGMSDTLKVVSFVALAVVIIVAAAVVLTRAPIVSAQTIQAASGQADTGITVSATGEAKGKPDVAYVNLGVRTTAETATDAMDQNTAAMNEVIAKLTDMGVDKKDMQTGTISLSPQMGPVNQDNPNTAQIVGYWATNSLKVTVNNLDQVGAILDEAVSAGANSVSGISFGLKDDSALQDAALQDAVKNARSRADVAAAGLGLTVTSVQSVTVDSYGGPTPLYIDFASAAPRAAAASVPVEPGEVTVNASVRVTFGF
jgi:uncharacterized protein YggE